MSGVRSNVIAHPASVAARAAEAQERVLKHAVALYVAHVPVAATADADAIRADVAAHAPDAATAVEEALFHHGPAVFAARVNAARGG